MGRAKEKNGGKMEDGKARLLSFYIREAFSFVLQAPPARPLYALALSST